MISIKEEKLEKFPVRYEVHKYLGRKPWYAIKTIVSEYTKPEDTVIDLFAGSGVAAFEALRLNRKVIAIDHSPLSELIVKSLCEGCKIEKYDRAASSIVSKLKTYRPLYQIKVADRLGELKSWQPNLNIGKVYFPDDSFYMGDLKHARQVGDNKEFDKFEWEHADGEIPVIDGNNVTRWGEIFSRRGAYILYRAVALASKEKDEQVKTCLLTAISAAIEKISLLNEFKSSGGGWLRHKPLCYYKSEDFIEFNAIDALENKINKMAEALEETGKLLKRGGDFTFIRKRAEELDIKNVANLIIMDPPYLDEVSFDRLEALHDIWLGFTPSKQDVRFSFETAAKKAVSALKDNSMLVLLMSEYLPESREFLINSLLNAGLVKIEETHSSEGKKEGLTKAIFRKA